MTDLHQSLMNQAYDRWQKSDPHWSKQEWEDTFTPQERFAVHTGNFNYQVCNGGFMQWWDNRYGTPSTVEFLLRAMERMNTDTAKAVAELLKEYKRAIDDHNNTRYADEQDYEEIIDRLDPLDKKFYEIDEQFLKDCEAHLQAGRF